mmetsp:Transcript_13933/g.38027  ORF Transcript_13933/g.38027 Transcript_13933/m.38027 type:complete len:204 (+) Transcript_13933:1365-1976(+)
MSSASCFSWALALAATSACLWNSASSSSQSFHCRALIGRHVGAPVNSSNAQTSGSLAATTERGPGISPPIDTDVEGALGAGVRGFCFSSLVACASCSLYKRSASLFRSTSVFAASRSPCPIAAALAMSRVSRSAVVGGNAPLSSKASLGSAPPRSASPVNVLGSIEATARCTFSKWAACLCSNCCCNFWICGCTQSCRNLRSV